MSFAFVLKKEKNFLFFLFFLSFFVRIIFFYFFLQHGQNYLLYNFDSNDYHNLALQIAKGKAITNADGTPHYYRLPGYSLFLAGCYKIFDCNIKKTLLMQILITSIIPILIFCLSLVLFPHNFLVAKMASLLSSCHIGFVLYSGLLATETLFIPFFLLFFIFLLPNFFRPKQHSPSLISVLLAGLFLGIASLIRPIGHFFIILAIILLLFSSHSLRSKIKTSFLLFLGWLSIVAWWLLRNYVATGCIFFTPMGGTHFLQYLGTGIVMQTDHLLFNQAHVKLFAEWDAQKETQEKILKRPLHEYERSQLGEKIAFSYAKKHPLYALNYCLTQLAKTCCALHSTQMIITDTGVWPDCGPHISLMTKIKRYLSPTVKTTFLIPLIYWDIFILLFTLIGFLLFLVSTLWDIQARYVAINIIPYISLFIFLTLAYGCARLRFPIEPLLFIPAIYALRKFFT